MKRLALIALLIPLLSGCFIATTIHGNGTVTTPATGNFDCSTGQSGECQKEYFDAGTETFHAEADPGYTFQQWTYCPYETLETCELNWPANEVGNPTPYPVHATFVEEDPPVQAAEYTYNALGQRITKTVGNTTTIFQYDLDGNLMAEIDAATGEPVREHVHVNGEPIAMLSTAGDDVTISYVTADHLGTPTLLTNKNGQVVADIEATPFGERFIDYDEVGHFRRFPGQYRDEETGLHYNYFRDYDPSLGRYLQSDPIGLLGGLNIYAYVEGNPMVLIDRFGLDPGEFFESYREAFFDASSYQSNYAGGVGQFEIQKTTRDGCDGYTYEWFNDNSPPPPQPPPYYRPPQPEPKPPEQEHPIYQSPEQIKQGFLRDLAFQQQELEKIRNECLMTVGKTALAIEIAGQAAERVAHGVGANTAARRIPYIGYGLLGYDALKALGCF